MRTVQTLFVGVLLTCLLAACNAPLPLPAESQGMWLMVTARTALAPDGHTLVDLRAAKAHIYITDSADQLHVLDQATLAPIRTLTVSGEFLTLDAAHDRLYVAPGNRYLPPEQAPEITAIDTRTLEPIGTLHGRFVSVDAVHQRVYTGGPLTLEAEQALETQASADGVRLYDGASLVQLAIGKQPGMPVYNPARDELLIVAYTVYTADAQTLALQRDLLPELAEQELRWCTGCKQAAAATVFAASSASSIDLLALEMNTQGGGKGGGIESERRWLEARTLEPVVHAPAVQTLCGTQKLLRPPVNGRLLRSLSYSRYLEIHNVLVEDLTGARLRQIDGMQLLFVDAQNNQGIAAISHSQNVLLDLASGSPISALPGFCVLGVDGGALYGASGGDLLRLEPSSKVQELPMPPVGVVDAPIEPGEVLATDGPNGPELFSTDVNGYLYRSVDGGQTWQHLRGGLPQWAPSDSDVVALRPSPNYAADTTLFFAGVINGHSGLGVWRSTDGGESWQPTWRGLDHLRVTRLLVSPNFAKDGALWAHADFATIVLPPPPGQLSLQQNGETALDILPELQTGRSLWQSTDRGESWRLLATAASDAGLPVPSAE